LSPDEGRNLEIGRNRLSVSVKGEVVRRAAGENIWLGSPVSANESSSTELTAHPLNFEVLESEEKVGLAQWDEIQRAAAEKQGDLVIVLLGGRGAQALHRQLGEISQTDKADELLKRCRIFTQDALAPMRMDNGFSFVRDFERLLGEAFFKKVKSFTPMRTDTSDLEGELSRYLDRLRSLGGIDIFFLGFGPEANAASHLAYIKPGSGATASDLAGVIPVSSSILEHHISKFRVGGSFVTPEDEEECRRATHIFTLGPAAILSARKVVQSVVDASTAPSKRISFRNLLDTEISTNAGQRANQMDENPGLWIRLHSNARSLILQDVLHA
jgi:6-phosphogluconolactonase/glucosamine-6-phosphate isomerase/deaminase